MKIVINGEALYSGCEGEEFPNEEESEVMFRADMEAMQLEKIQLRTNDDLKNWGGDLHVIKHYGFGKEQVISCGSRTCTRDCRDYYRCNIQPKEQLI